MNKLKVRNKAYILSMAKQITIHDALRMVIRKNRYVQKKKNRR